jgi:hypothetical protein
VTATALPLASRNPLLVEEKPLDGPGDDPIHDVFIWPPFIFPRIMDTQARERGGITEAKDVLRRFARTARMGADGWIDDEHADIRILQKPAIEHPPRKIDDANAVGLTDRAERAFPDAHPAGVRDKTELRAFRPQSLILLLDRQRTHRSLTPRTAPRGGPRRRRHGCGPQGRNAPAA